MKDTAVFLDQELISKGGSVEDYTISLEEYIETLAVLLNRKIILLDH